MAEYVQQGLLAADLLCPQCQHKGLVNANLWQCKSCQKQYDFSIYCELCGDAVQRLTGCGSSEHYYCRTCKTPVSRKAVLYTMTEANNLS